SIERQEDENTRPSAEAATPETCTQIEIHSPPDFIHTAFIQRLCFRARFVRTVMPAATRQNPAPMKTFPFSCFTASPPLAHSWLGLKHGKWNALVLVYAKWSTKSPILGLEPLRLKT